MKAFKDGDLVVHVRTPHIVGEVDLACAEEVRIRWEFPDGHRESFWHDVDTIELAPEGRA